MTEDTLIAAAAGGDEHAFSALLDLHYDRIYRFAYRWCGSVADAEAVTQLACNELARSIGQFRGDMTFSYWLCRLTLNCADTWQQAQSGAQGETERCIEGSGDGNVDQGVLPLLVVKVIDAMGDGYKETALLVLGEGLSYAEAGELLGEDVTTIEHRLGQMRQQLAAVHEQQGGQAL